MQTDAEAAPGPAIALFQHRSAAESAARQLGRGSVPPDQVRVLGADDPPSDLLALGSNAAPGDDLQALLVGLGVPEGEARYYTQAVGAGQTLLVARTARREATQRQLRAAGGVDATELGEELLRGTSDASDLGSTGPAPADITLRWEDVAPRYEMIWAQHFGAQGGEWADAEPTYRRAWALANQPALRGRPWRDVVSQVRQAWEATPDGTPWEQAEPAVEDVWRDVSEEAQMPEGGAARRVPRP
ncbi:MAG: hypothetical protein JO023_25595 [Chloroflexi bacterium]|nr:hypothetical protein [Chloroflexota bacterium]